MSLAIFRFGASEHDGAAPVIGYSRQGFAVYDGLRDLLTSEWQSLTSVRSKMYGNRSSLMNGSVIGYGGIPVLVPDY